MRKTITYNCFSFADLEHLEGEEWLPAGRGGKILCICEGDTASNEVFFSRKLQFQVLENIVSRQGSSQLASSPLKVLASWLALTHIVIIVIRQMQCCQWRAVSHLELFKKHVMLPQSSIMLLYQRFHYLLFHRFAYQRALGALYLPKLWYCLRAAS